MALAITFELGSLRHHLAVFALCRWSIARTTASAASASGHVPEGWRDGIGPRQEIVDAAVRVAIDDSGDDVGKIGLRFDAEKLAGLDQRGDDGPVLAATIGAGEESVLPVGRRAPWRTCRTSIASAPTL